ncbi:nucleosome assembly protein 1;2 isoform X2 [Lycium barbarum]|uniref:nucleosome assembly protein 1;2 isoform X2 n=1 Tax=Lycium barbarum TaxID=112863 RepID=UPI00293EB30B|nr:nucleosome assembly protein 1;2 isoform X2 [Lycium barbarum]
MSNPKDNFSVADLSAALNAGDRADLVNVLKNKLQDLTGKHTDVLENLSPNVRKRVERLREIQTQHDDLEAKFFEERAALEAKYQKLYQPLYTKRFEIVTGVVEVEGATTEATAENQQADKDAVEKGVPDFWLTAMKNNEVLAEEITERDEEALKFLRDIKWSKIDDPKGFKLEFFFETNPYFKNTVLSKTYHMIDEDEPILEKAIGTEIEWYPGKCLTQKILKKKPKKGSKNAKPITKTEQCESFFNFFSPPQVPEDEEDIDEDAVKLQNLMEQDYDVGSTIRDKIIPHAVSWFTGDAAEDDYADLEDDEDEDDDDDEENDEEDEDEEDEDDDEDEEEQEEETKTKTKKKSSAARKRSVRAPAGDGQSGERPPECKQQ